MIFELAEEKRGLWWFFFLSKISRGIFQNKNTVKTFNYLKLITEKNEC